MTLPDTLRIAMARLRPDQGMPDSIASLDVDAWQYVCAHLLSQDAEIVQLKRKNNLLLIAANDHQDRADLAESSLAAADALLRRTQGKTTTRPRSFACPQTSWPICKELEMNDVPEDVLLAAETLGRYFRARGAIDWQLGDCASRAELRRLEQENTELRKSALGGYEDGWHALRNERDALKAELAQYRATNESVRVCREHASEIVGDGECLVCELTRLKAGLRESSAAAKNAEWIATQQLMRAEEAEAGLAKLKARTEAAPTNE